MNRRSPHHQAAICPFLPLKGPSTDDILRKLWLLAPVTTSKHDGIELSIDHNHSAALEGDSGILEHSEDVIPHHSTLL